MDYIKRAKYFQTKKRLGQNFLVDSNVIQKIINESDLSVDDIVIEIGAGIGFVTEQLAQKANKVLAIEIDTDAIRELRSLPYKNINIIEQDILKIDISQLVSEPVKIVANIPYYITSPILVHLLGEISQSNYQNREAIKEIILMVQYEVAKRIVATEQSKSKEYGLLSILCNYWTEPQFLCKVPTKSFYPAPKVDSALIKLSIRKEPLVKLDSPDLFKKVINASFNMRRKNIKNALSKNGFNFDVVEKALIKSNIAPTRRGETLSIQEFKILTDNISRLGYIEKQ